MFLKNRMIFSDLFFASWEGICSGSIWSRMWMGRVQVGRLPRRLVSVHKREEEFLNKGHDCWDTFKNILTFFLSFCGNEALCELNDKMTWLFGRVNESRN